MKEWQELRGPGVHVLSSLYESEYFFSMIIRQILHLRFEECMNPNEQLRIV